MSAADSVGSAANAAAGLGIPEGTARGWLRCARAQAVRLYEFGVRATVTLGQELLPTAVLASPLAQALGALGAASLAMARRFGLDHVDPWARIKVLTSGGLLSTA